MGNGVIGHDVPAGVSTEDERPKYVCPKCGGRLQFTITKWGNFDEITGEPDDNAFDDNGTTTVYCSGDCFVPVEVNSDAIQVDGEIALNAAYAALEIPFPVDTRHRDGRLHVDALVVVGMEPRLVEGKWTQIGEIGVDAGLCWIGDPCYILHREGNNPESIGKNWDEFCALLGKPYPTAKQFCYDAGHPGLGVCVSTGYGDGVYPVEVKHKDGRIKEVRVKFF